MFLARVVNAEGDDDAVLADVQAVDQQRQQVEPVERGRSPGLELRGRRVTNADSRRACSCCGSSRPRGRFEASRILPRRDADEQLLDRQ